MGTLVWVAIVGGGLSRGLNRRSQWFLLHDRGLTASGVDRLVLVTEILGFGAVTACGGAFCATPATGDATADAGVLDVGALEPLMAAGLFGLAAELAPAAVAADVPGVAACACGGFSGTKGNRWERISEARTRFSSATA